MHSVGRMGGKRKRNRTAALSEETGSVTKDSASSTTEKSLELVAWRDANFYESDADDWDGDYIVHTVGWTEEENEWLKIVGEQTPDGERGVTRVPLVNVVKRTRLLNWTWTTSPSPTDSISSTSRKSEPIQVEWNFT